MKGSFKEQKYYRGKVKQLGWNISFSVQSNKLFHFQAPLEVANPIFLYKSFFFGKKKKKKSKI